MPDMTIHGALSIHIGCERYRRQTPSHDRQAYRDIVIRSRDGETRITVRGAAPDLPLTTTKER